MKGNDSATMTSLEGALATVNGQPAGAVTTTTTTANSANSGNSTAAAAVGGDKAFRHELENIADVSVECPLCMENLDIDDVDFFPCSCGYQVCRFCWHRLKNDENGLCPACRQPYPDSPIHFSSISIERVEELKKLKKKQKEKSKIKDNSKANLATIRVVQKNLLFVIGFSQRLSQEDLRKEFAKYGKIIKMVINASSAYVTYTKAEDAVAAIKSLNELSSGGVGKNGTAGIRGGPASAVSGISSLRASLGTTKYCTHWLRSQSCPKQPDCMYLHDVADQEASFTKEEMQVGKHTEYEKRLITHYLDVITKEKEAKERPAGCGSVGSTPVATVIPAKPSAAPCSLGVNGTDPNSLRSWSTGNAQQHSSQHFNYGTGHHNHPTETDRSPGGGKCAPNGGYPLTNSSSSSSLFSSSTSSSSSCTVPKNSEPAAKSINGKSSSTNSYGKKSSHNQGDSETAAVHHYQHSENTSAHHPYPDGARRKTSAPSNGNSSKESTPEVVHPKSSSGGKSAGSPSSAIKIQSTHKSGSNSCDSSSGNSSLSSTPNQTDPTLVFANYCSSASSSSGTSSLNLCDSSDSGAGSNASSNSSTPDNIQKETAAAASQQATQPNKTEVVQQVAESVLKETDGSADSLVIDDDDDLDFDPIAISSRALDDMLRNMNIGSSSLGGGGQANGFTGGLNGFNSSPTRPQPQSQPAGSNLFSLFNSPAQQQQPAQPNMLDLLESAFSSPGKQQSLGSGLFNGNAGNGAFGFGGLNAQQQHHQQQQRAHIMNHQQQHSSQQAHLLEQIQQLQHQRQLEMQQKMIHQSEKSLFAGSSLFSSLSGAAVGGPTSPAHSPAMYGSNSSQQQQQQPPTNKLWQQNSLRQLLPNVNIKFGQPTPNGLGEDDLAAIASFGINPFTGQPTQSLSPSALNAAAAASFFGSNNGGANQGMRPNPMQSNSQMLNNTSGTAFWQANGHQSSPQQQQAPPTASSLLAQHQQHQQHQQFFQQQQQQQLLRMQQQQRAHQQQQQQQQGSNFNSFFMNQFVQNSPMQANGGPTNLNRPPPGF